MDASTLILEQIRDLKKDLQQIRDDGSKRGRDIWDKLNGQEVTLAVLGDRLGRVEEKISGQELTLQEYQDLKKKAEGAGWLGRRLLWVGSLVLGAAGWIYASWSTIASTLKWMIGR